MSSMSSEVGEICCKSVKHNTIILIPGKAQTAEVAGVGATGHYC